MQHYKSIKNLLCCIIISVALLTNIKRGGNKFIDNLAKDIKLAYPNSTGYSIRNLKYMAKFASNYDEQFVQVVSAQIPWGPILFCLIKY